VPDAAARTPDTAEDSATPKGSRTMRIAVHTRQDFTVTDPDRLVAAARFLDEATPGLDDPARAPRAALGTLIIEYGSDELADRAEEFGLLAGDSSTVLSHEDAAAADGDCGRVPRQLDAGSALDAV
jgi:hypothetical protein